MTDYYCIKPFTWKSSLSLTTRLFSYYQQHQYKQMMVVTSPSSATTTATTIDSSVGREGWEGREGHTKMEKISILGKRQQSAAFRQEH